MSIVAIDLVTMPPIAINRGNPGQSVETDLGETASNCCTPASTAWKETHDDHDQRHPCLSANEIAKDEEVEEEKRLGRRDKSRTFLYQISCQTCLRRHRQTKGYMGIYASGASDRKRSLTVILKQHFAQVSRLVRDEHEGASESRCDGGFASSSLALHLAGHCEGLSNEEEVVKWCMDNVKVELVETLTLGSARR